MTSQGDSTRPLSTRYPAPALERLRGALAGRAPGPNQGPSGLAEFGNVDLFHGAGREGVSLGDGNCGLPGCLHLCAWPLNGGSWCRKVAPADGGPPLFTLRA
jgi:hypothetical protein